MNSKSLRILEYQKILNRLSAHAASQGAKKMCWQLKPLKNREDIESRQQNTRDAFLRMEKLGSVSFAGLQDIRSTEPLLRIGSPLSTAELLSIASTLECAEAVRQFGNRWEAEDSLTSLFHSLSPETDVSSEIRRCILSEDEFADDASPALRQIRRKITSANARLHSELESLIRREDMKDKLMDQLITTRQGRYCIPVRAEYRSAVPGMIHDRSQTGSTLFIEPMSSVNLNNEIMELHEDEREEIRKILERLSHLAGSVLDSLMEDYQLLTRLDFIFAKAKFAKDLHASQPVLNDEGIVDLKSAVHPLLNPASAVPIDLKLGETYTLLIVTGPNTGGKTVSLKTLGLLALMAQSGLHIPAAEGSRLPIFTDIFADIGDEQSIEQNLSTFSSHMSNIIYIVKHAGKGSLCLLDEPGGGTDPAEGAALAIAILNDLKQKGACVMASTHYTELKTYAISTEGVENASCEFDLSSLRPTYRLMIGVPGSSNAFMIAGKLGMPDEIIQDARENLDEKQIAMEEVIQELEKARREAAADRETAEQLKTETIRLRQSLTDKNKNLDEKRNEILRKARQEAEDILSDAKETADQAIRDYNRWLNHPQQADSRKMEQERTRLRRKRNAVSAGTSFLEKKGSEKTSSGQRPSDFSVGDRVMVLSLNTEGEILYPADSKGILTVQMGILTSRFPASDLQKLPDKKEKKYHPTGSSAGRSGKAMTFVPEINLLGMTVDEATSRLDKFLDDALMVHADRVRIVHGKGTGALRKGIREYLKHQRFVKNFEDAPYGEGDSGVTIVEL